MQEVNSPFAAHKDEHTGDAGVSGFNFSFGSNAIPSQQVILREIGRLQAEVNNLREHLLLERAKLRLAGEDVRTQRIKTSHMEGSLLTSLRILVNDNRMNLPSSIEETYEKVEQARDKLGEMEDDYLLDEKAQGAVERLFMQKEDTFYQHRLPELLTQITSCFSHQHMQPNSNSSNAHYSPPPPPPPPPNSIVLGQNMVLVHDAPPPPPPSGPIILGDNMVLVRDAPPPPPSPPSPLSYSKSRESPNKLLPASTQNKALDSSSCDVEMQYNLAKAELVDLRKEFDSLRPQQSEVIKHDCGSSRRNCRTSTDYTSVSDFEEKFSDVLSRLSNCEVKVQRLHVETAQFHGISDKLQRRKSAPLQTDRVKGSPLISMVRSQTVVAPEGYNKIQMQSRVRDWVLEYSKSNPIIRKVHANILKMEGIQLSDSDSLKEWTEAYWPMGVAERSSLSAGDEPMNMSDNSAILPYPSHRIISGTSQEMNSAKEPSLGKQSSMAKHFCFGSDQSCSLFSVPYTRPGSAVENTSVRNWETQQSPSPSYANPVSECSPIKLPGIEGDTPSKQLHHHRCRSVSTIPMDLEARGSIPKYHRYAFRDSSIANSACTV